MPRQTRAAHLGKSDFLPAAYSQVTQDAAHAFAEDLGADEAGESRPEHGEAAYPRSWKRTKRECEYCEAYVEADENEKCPLCNAPLGNVVAAERAREERAEQALREQEIEKQAQEAKDSRISDIIKGVTSVATAFAASAGATGAAGAARHPDERRGGPHGGVPPRGGMSNRNRPSMGGPGPGGPGMRR